MDKKLIYHYTDINALKSILINKSLWMTSHEFLNDTEEFKDGYKRLRTVIDNCLDKNDSILLDSTKEAIYKAIDLLDNTIILSTSFSKNGDLLSQWRSYCPSYGGFSIGFDREAFDLPYKADESYLKLYDCIYDEEEKIRLAKLFGETTILQHNERENFDKIMRTSFESTVYYFLLFIISSKNKHFKEEQEVKLATYIHKDLIEVDIEDLDNGNILAQYENGLKLYSKKELSFRNKANILIPYLNQPFNIDCIKEIIIGPTQNIELTKKSLEFFIKNIGLEIDVKYSDIPYRAI